jgi:hypothetical protein
MTAFFSAPDASARSIHSVDAADQPDVRSAIASFDGGEFDMLLRAVELVAQSQAFSPLGLQHALRLTPQLAGRLTIAMQLMAIISPTASAESDTVLVGADALPVLIPRLRANWRDLRMSNAA